MLINEMVTVRQDGDRIVLKIRKAKFTEPKETVVYGADKINASKVTIEHIGDANEVVELLNPAIKIWGTVSEIWKTSNRYRSAAKRHSEQRLFCFHLNTL